MALILNNQHDDYDSERMRTYESFAAQSQPINTEDLDVERENIKAHEREHMLSHSIRRDRSSVVTDREQVEANDDILNTSMGSIQTFKPSKRSKKRMDNIGEGEKACAECTIF